MDARRSGTPDAQVQGQSQSQGQGQGQTSDARDSKTNTRSYNISSPTHRSQGTGQDPPSSKLKRSDTNPNLTYNKAVTEENDLSRQSNVELQRYTDRLQEDVLNQHERIHQAENQLRAANRQLRESQEKARFLEIELDNLRVENERQKLEASIAIQSMEKEHSQHKAADEAQIRRLLDGATRNKVEGRWNPPPDQDVRQRLNLLNTNIREWSRNWATKSLVLDKSTSAATVEYFADFLKLDPDANLPQMVLKPSAKMGSKVAALLLHAALSHEVHDAFFDCNFFCLKAEDRVVLERLYDQLRRADSTNTHIWRAGLWRLMNPFVPEGSVQTPSILEASRSNIREYCETIGSAFLKKPASILFSVVAENSTEAQTRATRLQAILLQASTIGLMLWTQHAKFTGVDLKRMQTSNMTFDNTSPVLEPHPLSNVDEDNDMANGRDILMVSRPAIIAFDVNDKTGWEGGQYRVLSKAVVLLDGQY